MDIGVWMSREVWRHKSQSSRPRETWNLPELPDDFLSPGQPSRLFVAIQGQWRGYFLLDRMLWNPADRRAPFSLAFVPASWTPIDPVPAPSRPGQVRYTLSVPTHSKAGTT